MNRKSQEYDIINLRHAKENISKVFNILSARAMQATSSERQILKAEVTRLQLLSQSDDVQAMEEALEQFNKAEADAQNVQTISHEKREEQLIDRLTKLRR